MWECLGIRRVWAYGLNGTRMELDGSWNGSVVHTSKICVVGMETATGQAVVVKLIGYLGKNWY